MSLTTLPLSYCTNVHPGRTVADVIRGLNEYAVPARKRLGTGIAAGLWLPASAAEELQQSPRQMDLLKQTLSDGGLACHTFNAFPYGDFHSERVKENVYLPDWTSPDRVGYTVRTAQLLCELLPVGAEGSLSTSPLGFKGFAHPNDFLDRCIASLLETAVEFDRIHDDTGRVLRLAIEPEPCCVLETTDEAIQFMRRLFDAAEARGLADEARRHLGLCYDICHQAVEFEDVAASIAAIHAAEIRINKVHITCAIHVEAPGTRPDALQELAAYAEPRYLHQVFAKGADGAIASRFDLTEEFCLNPPPEFASAEAWRVHFHVPVHRQSLGALSSTQGDIKRALLAVQQLPYAPHLEVETYTWGVLPEDRRLALAEGIEKELSAATALLEDVRRSGPLDPAG